MNDLFQPPPLPATREDMLATRKAKKEPSLIDHVESIHKVLYDDPAYKRLLTAARRQDAVEGSLIADDLMAAHMIRAQAVADHNEPVTNAPLNAIKIALKRALERYEMLSRKKRYQAALSFEPPPMAAE